MWTWNVHILKKEEKDSDRKSQEEEIGDWSRGSDHYRKYYVGY